MVFSVPGGAKEDKSLEPSALLGLHSSDAVSRAQSKPTTDSRGKLCGRAGRTGGRRRAVGAPEPGREASRGSRHTFHPSDAGAAS